MSQFPEIKNLNYQTLAITAGWRVVINNFFELDPDDDLKNREVINMGSDKENLSPWEKVLKTYFFDDLFYAESEKYGLDLGWYGGEEGSFRIVVITWKKPDYGDFKPKRKIKLTVRSKI